MYVNAKMIPFQEWGRRGKRRIGGGGDFKYDIFDTL
jgi:hypothetical protein